MRITFKQEGYNTVVLTLGFEEFDTVLDMIGEDQIAEIIVSIKKPEADNGEKD